MEGINNKKTCELLNVYEHILFSKWKQYFLYFFNGEFLVFALFDNYPDSNFNLKQTCSKPCIASLQTCSKFRMTSLQVRNKIAAS